MKKAFVFHAKKMDPLGEMEEFEPFKFNLVAIVDLEEEMTGPGIHNELEFAYRVTNNIGSQWTLNPFVHPVIYDLVRSTSVGDVVMIDNESYLCSFADWKKVPMKSYASDYYE